MLNSRPVISVSGYEEPSYYVDSRPVAGVTVFGGKSDVRINKKEDMKPKQGLLMVAGITAALLYVAYKIDERI